MPKPTRIGTREMPSPKPKEATMSPRMIVEILTGQDISLSRVLACVSHGATAGEMAVALKKSTIPSSPGIMKSILSSLPTAKARNKNSGNRMPNITTGPLE